MRWLWPSGLAGRFALVLALVLVGVQLSTLPFLLRQQSDVADRLYRESTVDRIAEVIKLFEPLDAGARRELLPAISSPFLTLDLFFEPVARERTAVDESGMATVLSRQLEREVIIKRIDEEAEGLPGLLPTRQRVAIWVPLADSSWLRFSTHTSEPSSGWVAHFSAQLLLLSLVLVAVALFIARQLTRPIRTFVAAAERLGKDVNAPPIAERGSRELRAVAKVFNTMQSQLQRYVNDKTHMLAAISHDLRTSLTRLHLRVQFIDDAEQQRKAEQDLEQMDAMLAATLAFARDDAHDEEPVPVDLAKLLHTLCDDYDDLDEDVSYEGPESLTLQCRPLVMTRAIGNVVSNAIRYGRRARVQLLPVEGGCEIRIQDDGPGIPVAEQARVFEPFVRLDPARSLASGGTGLGLSIARSALRSHGGDVTLHNLPEGGLEVRLTLVDAFSQ